MSRRPRRSLKSFNAEARSWPRRVPTLPVVCRFHRLRIYPPLLPLPWAHPIACEKCGLRLTITLKSSEVWFRSPRLFSGTLPRWPNSARWPAYRAAASLIKAIGILRRRARPFGGVLTEAGPPASSVISMDRNRDSNFGCQPGVDVVILANSLPETDFTVPVQSPDHRRKWMETQPERTDILQWLLVS
jgi:hypothetical protein